MVKKIKFALDMANGIKVRTLEELRCNFDLEKTIGYYLDGKLVEWLEDRYYDDEATNICNLNSNQQDFNKLLCQVLGAEYAEADIDITVLEAVNHKKAQLKQLTSDETIIANAAQTAFTQADLAELLAAGNVNIYLCGKEFMVPIDSNNRHYVGIINKPEVYINAQSLAEIAEANIVFENVYLPEHLQEKKLEDLVTKKKLQTYKPSALFDFMLDKKDRIKSEELFYAAQDILRNCQFDIDVSSRKLEEIINKSNIRGSFDVDAGSRKLETAVQASIIRGGFLPSF